VALLDARGFREEDFARSHPGGSLGRRLLVHVGDLMRRGDALPRARLDTPFVDLMREMSAKGLGCAVIVDADERVRGIFTDGDLRRLVEQGADLRALVAGEVMHARPRTIRAHELAAVAAERMEAHRITALVVDDEAGRLVGMVSVGDLMRAKVI